MTDLTLGLLHRRSGYTTARSAQRSHARTTSLHIPHSVISFGVMFYAFIITTLMGWLASESSIIAVGLIGIALTAWVGITYVAFQAIQHENKESTHS
ncbi:MAG: hypothetical protein Q4P66_02100 [Actinomycetaceae bacterium]|nr:hypothetical protein [Actinomycetaceae bacterium]